MATRLYINYLPLKSTFSGLYNTGFIHTPCLTYNSKYTLGDKQKK